ncbi:hypothetical protein H4R35_005406 [Dimargaris xerosporica]|nr:hypothetical protein H4R35_005406 [Dimargaris xerosporica]
MGVRPGSDQGNRPAKLPTAQSDSVDSLLHRIRRTRLNPPLPTNRPKPPPVVPFGRRRQQRRDLLLPLVDETAAHTTPFLEAVGSGNLPRVLQYLYPRGASDFLQTQRLWANSDAEPKFEELSSDGSTLPPRPDNGNTNDDHSFAMQDDELKAGTADMAASPPPSLPSPPPSVPTLPVRISPNVCDQSRRTALHIAASKGHVAIMLLLLRAGANVNAKDVLGNTPLHIAVISNHINCVLALLQAGAEIEPSTASGGQPGVSPLDLARSRLKFIRIRERDTLGHWEQEEGSMNQPTTNTAKSERWTQARRSFHQVVANVKQIVQILQYYSARALPACSQSMMLLSPTPLIAPTGTPLSPAAPPSIHGNSHSPKVLSSSSPTFLGSPSMARNTGSELDQLLNRLASLDLTPTATSTSSSAPHMPSDDSGGGSVSSSQSLVVASRHSYTQSTELEMTEILDKLENMLNDF